MSVGRDLDTCGKRKKNQLRDYMTTGPARFSAHRSSPAHVIRPLHVQIPEINEEKIKDAVNLP